MNANAIIGSVIGESRKRKGINQETLCQGLCSRAFFARVETGQRECEKILMDAFLQRAGVASDRFCYIADPEEQVVLICREKMYDAIEQNDVARAESAFAEYGMMDTAYGNNQIDENIWNIIEEEASYYFNNEKTAQEVTAIIQNRVELYLAEN